MSRLIASAISIALLARAGAAQSSPIPRDTLAARQLESIAATLKQPVALPTVPAFPDASAVRRWTDSLRYLARSTTSCETSACRATMRTLATRIDSIVGKPSQPVPAPQLPPADTSTFAGPAELPRVRLNYAYPTATRTVTVAGGANLQAVFDAAHRGDELVLACRASWSGNFNLPAKPGTGWIIIRSACANQLPPIGTRLRLSDSLHLARLVTTNSSAALMIAPGASGYWITGIEVTGTVQQPGIQFGLVYVGANDNTQTTLAQVPQDVVFDRVWVHGQTLTNTQRCISLHSGRTRITDSQLTDCHGKGFDSQAINGINGPGPWQIVNNHVEGAGENIMFGGGDPRIPGVVPSDIEIRRNYLYKPISWSGVWTVKNLLETKSAVRVQIEGNVLDGSWPDAQGGLSVLFRSTNQDGGCRWCRTTDLTFRRNLIRNAGAGILFVGSDNADTTLQRVLVSENVFDQLGVAPYLGAHAFAMSFTQGGKNITVERTVIVGPLYFSIRLDRYQTSSGVVFRDVVVSRGQHGVGADGSFEGTDGLQLGSPGYVWQNVTLLGPVASTYPPSTTFTASESQAPLAAQIRAIVQQATAGVVVP